MAQIPFEVCQSSIGRAFLQSTLSPANTVLFMQDVLTVAAGSARTFILNRPKALNSLTLDMVRFMLPVVKVRPAAVPKSDMTSAISPPPQTGVHPQIKARDGFL